MRRAFSFTQIFILAMIVITVLTSIWLFKLDQETFRSYKKQNVEMFRDPKILRVVVVDSKSIPKELVEVLDAVKTKGYKIEYHRVSTLDWDELKDADIVVCNVPIDTKLARYTMENILNSGKKMIAFRDCRAGSYDSKMLIEYKGTKDIWKDKLYKLEFFTSPLYTPTFDRVIDYTPLIDARINSIKCLYNSQVMSLIDGSSTYDLICYNFYNTLYIAYEMHDFFKDKPYNYDIILRNFLIH